MKIFHCRKIFVHKLQVRNNQILQPAVSVDVCHFLPEETEENLYENIW